MLIILSEAASFRVAKLIQDSVQFSKYAVGYVELNADGYTEQKSICSDYDNDKVVHHRESDSL
jgi:hypothetical protein